MRTVRIVEAGDGALPQPGTPGSDAWPGSGLVGAESVATDDSESPPSGDTVVVAAEDGERFVLSVDDNLRRALGLGAAGTAEEEHAMTTTRPAPDGPPMSPRDIQVRVRSGESPEDLAADSGTPLEKIMRFAFPVLEERARITDEARRARARRDGDGALVPFGDTVDRRFLAHNIDPSDVTWDSFRRPDGSWVVIASWTAGQNERHAHWAFSLAARTVLPADEVGSDLLSDRPLRPIVRAVPDPDEQRELHPELYDQEAPPPYPPQPYQPLRHEPPVRAEAVRPDAARRARPEPVAGLAEEPPLPLRLADPLPRTEDESDGSSAAGDAFARSHPSAAPERSEEQPEASPAVADAVTGSIEFDALFEANVIDELPEPPPKRSGSRSKAAREQTKIPSWDDILLGVRRKQD